MTRVHNLFNRKRVVMEFAPNDKVIGGLHQIGRYNYTSAQESLAIHSHHNAMEICFLVRGRQTYRVGNRDYVLSGGDVFLTFPDELHSTGGSPEEKGVLYWMSLQLQGRKEQPFLGLNRAQSAPLIRELLQLKTRHFRGAWEMKSLLDEITVAFHHPRTTLRATIIANRMVAFLLRLIDCARKGAPEPSSDRLRATLRHIEEYVTEPITISSLAQQAGLSVSRFKARFKEEVGMPPREYILRTKIEEARRRLAHGGTNVTETAFALGFPTSQYFATVFKRFTGKRPSEVQHA